MRRKILVGICVGLLTMPLVSNAALYLVDNGQGPVVVDTVTNRTWLADLSLSGSVTFYFGAFNWQNNVLNASNYQGYNTWRIPALFRYEDLWVNRMENEMWGEHHRLPFLNVPDRGILWINTLEQGSTSCIGNVWGEWIPCVWAFHLEFNGVILAHPRICYYESCIAAVFRAGQEPITPNGLFAGLALAVEDVGPGNSLRDKLALAKVYYDAGDAGATCPVLAAFTREMTAQSGKKVTAYDAHWFIEEVQALMDAIDCQ